MCYLFNRPIIKCIQKLKYQLFNHIVLNWIVLLIILSSVIWSISNIVLWVRNVCCHPLSYIVVTGKRYYTTNNDIYRAIEKLNTIGMFITQDVNCIQKKIELLPWVKQVSVRIQWPDTLKINVIEHIPVAFWNDSQIISTTGMMFNAPETCIDDNLLIPVLYGPRGDEKKILISYYMFNAILKTSTKLKIKSLKIDMRDSWELVFENDMYIKLGRKNIIERLNYFVKIYPILLRKSNENNKYIDYVDLRYTAGFAVKWIPNTITSVLCQK